MDQVITPILLCYEGFTLLGFLSHLWFSYYSSTYSGLDEKKKVMWNSRFVAMVHALCVVGPALWIILNEQLQKDPLYSNNTYVTYLTYFTSGYFVWDIVQCIQYYHIHGAMFLVHAVISLLSFLGALYPFNQYYLGLFLLYELSTIFMNYYTFMITTGETKGTLFLINKMLLMITYVGVRIILGPYFTYCLLTDFWNIPASDNYVVLLKILHGSTCCVSLGLNYVWLYSIYKYVKKTE